MSQPWPPVDPIPQREFPRGQWHVTDWINITGKGTVKGDGITDDQPAIQAMLDDAGPGATFYFPKGTYLLGKPLTPQRQQRLIGCHSPKYDPAEFPTTVCSLKAKTGFVGVALIEYLPNRPGVTIESLCLLGLGMQAPDLLHGIYVGATTGGEKQWWMKSLSISGFSGAGLAGSMWVGDMRDCHIGRCGYGVKSYNNERWVDTRIIGCQFYFNLYGGLEFDSGLKSGAVTIMGCRVERSGNQYGSPATPLHPDSFGIRLGHVNNFELIGVTTDACTGPGLWIGSDDPGKQVYSVIVTGSEFLRDGGGNQTPNAGIEGVRLRGCGHVQFVGNTIGYGEHDDGGGNGIVSPQYGISFEDTSQCQVGYCRIEVANFPESIRKVGDANYGLALNLQAHTLMSMPVSHDNAKPLNPGTGAMWYSTTDQKPKWWTGYKWVDAMNGDNVFPPGITPGLDLYGTSAQSKYLRFKSDDKVRWALTSQSNGNLTIERRDAAETYLDTPIMVRGDNGMIETVEQYVKSRSPDRVALEVRPAGGPYVSWFVVSNGTTSQVQTEVLWDGGFRSSWGHANFARVQLGSTQVVREGAGANERIFGCYSSTANAGNNVAAFEVYGSGACKGGDATAANEFVTRSQGDSRYGLASSREFKENIRPLNHSGPFDQINPVVFTYKQDTEYVDEATKHHGAHYGFIAEEVEAAGLGITHEADGSPLGLRPDELIAVLWAKVKEQDARIDRLESILLTK